MSRGVAGRAVLPGPHVFPGVALHRRVVFANQPLRRETRSGSGVVAKLASTGEPNIGVVA